MKYFKIYFIGTFSLIIVSTSFAQSWYEGIGGGYGFPVAGVQVSDETDIYPGSGNPSATWTTRTLSFGKGVNISGYSGHMFTKNVGVEFGASYLFGANTTASLTTIYPSVTSTTSLTYSAQMLRLIPAVRLEGLDGNLRVYAVAGFIYGIAVFTTVQASTSSVSTIDSNRYSGGYSLGFHGALGLRMIITPKTSVYIEINGNYQNYSPTKNVVNDNLVINYVSSGSFNTSALGGNGVELPKISLPFSSLGINIGLHYTFPDNPKSTVKK